MWWQANTTTTHDVTWCYFLDIAQPSQSFVAPVLACLKHIAGISFGTYFLLPLTNIRQVDIIICLIVVCTNYEIFWCTQTNTFTFTFFSPFLFWHLHSKASDTIVCLQLHLPSAKPLGNGITQAVLYFLVCNLCLD